MKNGQKPHRTQIGHGPPVAHISAHGFWKPPEATSSAQFHPSPQLNGKSFHSSMHPVLHGAGVVHIWYNIPLCTILAQQSNGNISGPNSMIPNQSFKIQHPFQRRNLQLISLAIHGGYQKTIEGPQPPGPAGVWLEALSGLF
ncbi:hypothetical protein O181_016389 [Austropuccinia psidii MF-1]|uniref:Uncharacterized protein n=1 Tax=Austropuccinia psidii MF-1 TaxID=1389203 RepID=A0A9Q3C3S2_9BASI|nr:hypothetical protein [Austropuccinia psidii MF-1]